MTAIVYNGWDAINQGHFEMHWISRSSLGGIVEGSKEGFLEFDDKEARRVGIGLMSLGSMVVIWSISYVLNAANDGADSKFSFGLMLLSFTCMLTAVVILFPPWRQSCIPFYTIFPTVPLVLLTRTAVTIKRSIKTIASGLFFFFFAGTYLDAEIGAFILCGTFATVTFMIYVLVMFPRRRDSLFPRITGKEQIGQGLDQAN